MGRSMRTPLGRLMVRAVLHSEERRRKKSAPARNGYVYIRALIRTHECVLRVSGFE
jgi:hypothetical protein